MNTEPDHPVDIANKFLVGAQGDRIVILNPPRSPLSREEALVLAAWLAALSDPGQEDFPGIFDQVRNT